MAASTPFVTVKKASSQAGRPSGKKMYVVLFKWQDVKEFEKDENGVRVTKLAFKEGAKPVALYGTPSTIKVSAALEGDEDAKGYIHKVELQHPGTPLQYDELMNDIANEQLGAVVFGCAADDAKLAGTPCAPLLVNSDESQDDNEANRNTLVLQSALRSAPVGRIARSLVPATGDSEVDAVLGLSDTGV